MIPIYRSAELLPVINAIFGVKESALEHKTRHVLITLSYFGDRSALMAKTQEEYGKIVEAEARRRSK